MTGKQRVDKNTHSCIIYCMVCCYVKHIICSETSGVVHSMCAFSIYEYILSTFVCAAGKLLAACVLSKVQQLLLK